MNPFTLSKLRWLWPALLVFGMTAVAQEATQEAEGAMAADVSVQTVAADTEALPEAEGFPPEQIEQLVAPVALYPDALLAQILMASTYPLDVVQAARWTESHSDMEGEALATAAEQESWDPSVQALVFFPSVLERMNKDLGWTQDLGEAYLGQEDEVIDTIQRLRQEAYEAGNLETNEQQQVVVEDDTIVVQPADPEVVYVPTYNPATVYAQPAPTTTYYPTVYQESSSWDGVSFATGALVGGLLTAAIMWDRNDNWCCGVYNGGPGYWGRPGYWGSPGYWDNGWRRPVNVDRNVNIKTGDITVNRGNKVGKWEHNPTHRGNINYKNERTKNRYSADLNRGVVDRDAARGRTADRTRSAGDLKRPASGDLKRPSGDLKRPASGDLKRPSGDLKRPASGDGKLASRDRKPAQTKGKAPATRDATKQPAKRDVQLKRPEQSKAKAPQKKVQKPATTQTREVNKSRQSSNTRAFKPSNGKEARASSNRGAKSVQRSGGAKSRPQGGGGGGNVRARRG